MLVVPENVIVIASQRVGAKRRPMTGSAKQSIIQHDDGLDCFVASLLAMTKCCGVAKRKRAHRQPGIRTGRVS
jgi:adenylyl- and sulfurtransferase ThiI